MVKGIFRCGTSNIVVPGTKATFPDAYKTKSRLHYYATLFNTLEINSSFYKVPLPATFEKWALDVPDDFQFTVKLWREITHAKGLVFDLNQIDFFMTAANGLGRKKGCLLIQFPASITSHFTDRIETILQRLVKCDPQQSWRLAVEFRHTSWSSAATYELLDRYKASIVLHDMPASKTLALNDKADFVYMRFHGPKGDYKDSYTEAFLQQNAAAYRQLAQSGQRCLCLFQQYDGRCACQCPAFAGASGVSFIFSLKFSALMTRVLPRGL